MQFMRIAVGILLAMGAAGPVLAQTANEPSERRTVVAIEFIGIEYTSEAYLRSIVRTAVGDPFDAERANEDVTRLLKTGKFLTVSVEPEATPEGVIVRYTVAERPVIQFIRFEGNTRFKDKRLRELVPVALGDPIDSFGVREGRQEILRLYREKAYGEVQVTIDEELLSQEGVLVYRIEEGPRVRVRKILFEGNDSIGEEKLLAEIKTQTYIWIFRDGIFDVEQVESDAAAIQMYYRDQGYLDARASYRKESGPDPEDITVVFTIVEGDRYTIESIRFTGNTVFTDEVLRSEMVMREGDPILQRELERDVKTIDQRYGEQGYIYATIQPIPVFSETPGRVIVTIQITEGEQIRVGRIVVRGNERTKDKVVRREIQLFPEDIYDETEARQAEQRLIQTQIFSAASIKPVGEAPGVRDIVVDVEESAKAGDFLFGAGVTSDSGLVGSIMLDMKNFDVFDWPRNFTEFFKLRSFHGAGQRLRIEAQPGTDVTRFRIDFVEPYFLDKPIRLGVSTYFFERERDSFNERRIGGNVSVGKRLNWPFLKDWYGEVAIRVEDVKIDDLTIWTPRRVREDKGNNLLTTAKVSFVSDTTDSRFVPTQGRRISVAYEQAGLFGGEHGFGKLTASCAWHKTLYTDIEDRKSVLTLRASGGGILGSAPVFERFFAGGIGSLRGFEFRGVSPRQGLQDKAIGGDLMLLAGAEYSFPLIGDVIRGVVFTDQGTVEDTYELTAWRMSVGFGVRLQVEFFGPVPLEFDLAAPLVRDGEDEEQVFSFYIGTVF